MALIKNLLTAFCLVVSLALSAQLPSTEHFRDLYFDKQYDQIIAEKPENIDDLEAKGIYYVAMAYYMKEDDDNAMKCFDKAIAKGPVDHDMYFYKGKIYQYAKNYKAAMPLFDKAIELYKDEPDFYIAKAQVFAATDKKADAITYYEKAIHYPNCNSEAYAELAEIYSKDGKDTAAVRVFKTGLALADIKADEEHYRVLEYNTGLYQANVGDYDGAKATFENHITHFPDDYMGIAKLIQAYYATGDYTKGKETKQLLYKAHDEGKLPQNMTKMFCFDQFMWNGQKVMAFEHYGSYKDADMGIYVKHGFYLLDKNGEIQYKIESESSAAVRMNEGDLYVLCKVEKGAHQTYWGYVFNDDYNYPDLKNAVIKILNNDSKPAATFIPGKNTIKMGEEKKEKKKKKKD